MGNTNIPVTKVHSYNVSVAADVGINAAVLFYNICYWVEENTTNDRNFINGKYWTYNTIKALQTMFPEMTKNQIEYALKKLKDNGYIESAALSEDTRDRTNYYTVCDTDKWILCEKKQNTISENSDMATENSSMASEKSDMFNIYNNKNTDTDNKQTDNNITDNSHNKYALKDKSFKDCDSMYASVSEKQEGEQKPKKKSRYISKDYTEKQLREHIRPTIRENFERIEIENGLGHIPDGEKLLEDITVEFFRQYEENMGVKHRPLPDKSYINVIRMFVCSTGELREYFDLETYEIMIKRYFETDFNRYGKYDGEVTLCLSHFMNDTIRNHLLNREGILWERAEEDYD